MCLLGVIDAPQITEPQCGTILKKFRSKKIVFYGQSDAEKFADFNGTIIFEIRQKMAEIS